MVNVIPASLLVTETEQKRRKHTLEKAKAIHLSRQLQMRLQYAKLKVDHGWQKQNLNEVENLYFRHSHMRGTKPKPKPASVMSTIPHPMSAPTLTVDSVKSNLSFLQHPSGSKTGSTSDLVSVDRDTDDPLEKIHPSPADIPPAIEPTPPTSDDADPIAGDQGQDREQPSITHTPQALTGKLLSPKSIGTGSNPASPSSQTRLKKARLKPTTKSKSSNLSSPPSISNINHHQDVSSSLLDKYTVPTTSPSRLNTPGGHSRVGSSILSGSGYEYTKNTLTYDSFWSFHSTSSVNVVAASVSKGGGEAKGGG